MTRHLQGQSPHFAFANSWLAQRVSEQGLTIEQLVQADGQAQAADQVSMGNSISSLRFLSSNDWRDFVEQHSLVETILREDRIYASMDFTTRDCYRHAVEEIARQSPLSEQDVAKQGDSTCQAKRQAGSESDAPDDERTAHVGYYLIDQGRSALEKNAAGRSSSVDEGSPVGRSRSVVRLPFERAADHGMWTVGFLNWVDLVGR